MYKAVIFDLDGTLLDTIEDLTAAGNWVCRANGWPEHTVEQFKAKVGHGLRNLVTQLLPDSCRASETVEAALAQYMAYYGEHSLIKTHPYEGIPELLEKMKAAGIQMAVCSNKADAFTRVIIDHYFPGVFQAVRGKLEGVPVKPDPAGVLGIMEQLGAKPETALFVGDSGTDIRTGHNAGMDACGVSWGFRPRKTLVEADADYLADTVAELEAVIFGENGIVLSFEEVGAYLDQVADSFPEVLFDGLNGGVNLQEDTVPDPEFPEGEMYILGEYCEDLLGRYINLYYGSFAALAEKEAWDRRIWEEELRVTLSHELTHHMESKGGLHALDDRDAAFLAAWKEEYGKM